jgi:hypothetical protein
LTPKSDETGNSGTLPVPELNPLLNPLLNKNLGRWAEVYFTNPPERRDEAVLNLVHELENAGDAPGKKTRHSNQARSEKRSSDASSPVAKGRICPDCGFENDVHQRFCGECGSPLAARARATSVVSRPLEAQRAQNADHERGIPAEESIELAPQFGSILHLSDPVVGSVGRGSGDPRWHNDARALGTEEPAPLRRSYRAYIGLVLAMVIGGLAYMAWRGGQSAPERTLFPVQAPPAAVQRSPVAPAAKSQPATQTPAPAAAAPAVATNEKPQNALRQPSTSTPKTAPAVPKDSVAVSANGGQELATALSFLNGTGQQHDSAAAAQWLWKAVEKKNTAATVLLAGLYLRGDGVQKNCDQGRVLLDAAADKGNKDAAGLLRNLQAFGCE